MIEKPLWISHRGYKKNAVENTRAAFRAAVDLGFDCLETDLRITIDDRIVLIHDPTLARLSGKDQRVQDMTAAELAKIRLKPLYRSDDRLMFLDDFVEEFTATRWVFDIKPETGARTIQALGQWARARGMVKKIAQNAKFLTWQADHEALAATHFPGVPFYARQSECWRAGLAVLLGVPRFGAIRPGKTYALPATVMGLSLFKTSIVRRFHERNASVIAFLPPTDTLARRAAAVGFDEILTEGGRP
jgi:glycerophosphoryl diester phosphodiesterase